MTLILFPQDPHEAPSKAGTLTVHHDATHKAILVEHLPQVDVGKGHTEALTRWWSELGEGRSKLVDLTSKPPELTDLARPKNTHADPCEQRPAPGESFTSKTSKLYVMGRSRVAGRALWDLSLVASRRKVRETRQGNDRFQVRPLIRR